MAPMAKFLYVNSRGAFLDSVQRMKDLFTVRQKFDPLCLMFQLKMALTAKFLYVNLRGAFLDSVQRMKDLFTVRQKFDPLCLMFQ